MTFLPSMNNLISNILQLTVPKYIIWNPKKVFMMMCSLCPLGPFLLAWSHICTQYTHAESHTHMYTYMDNHIHTNIHG